MNIPNDIWRNIIKELDRTSSLVLKRVNKQIYNILEKDLIKRTHNIFEIIYNNYYSLFFNELQTSYLENRLKISHNPRDLSYVCGLSCSREFASWLTDNSLMDYGSLLKGALRSGNLEFVKYIHRGPDMVTFSDVVNSQSIEVTKYMIKHSFTRVAGRYSISNILLGTASGRYYNLEASLSFTRNLNFDYLDYLLIKNYVHVDSVVENCIRCRNDSVRIFTCCENNGYIFNPKILGDICAEGNISLLKYIISKYNPSMSGLQMITTSINIYDYLKNIPGSLDIEYCLQVAIERNKFEFIKHLTENDARGNNNGIIVSAALLSNDILRYFLENGYHLPNYVWNLLMEDIEEVSKINLDTLKLLDQYGCDWNESAAQYLAVYGDMELLEYAIDRGAQLPADIINFLLRQDWEGQFDWFIDRGYNYNDESLRLAILNGDESLIEQMIKTLPVTKEHIKIVSISNLGEALKLKIIDLLFDRYVEQNQVL